MDFVRSAITARQSRIGFNENFLFFYPQGLADKWHQDFQVFLATLFLSHKYQFENDRENNNNTVSTELKEILERARELLCNIEHFINATLTNKPASSWYTPKEMEKIVKLNKTQNFLRINNLFVKARFQDYINKMLRRIKHFDLNKNMKKTKSATHQQRSNSLRNRNNRKGRRRTTKKTVIITTKRNRNNPGRQRKQQRKQQRVNLAALQ